MVQLFNRYTFRERIFIGTFVLLNIALPLCLVDFYPFSSMPMFSAAPKSLAVFTAVDQHERPLSLANFHLQQTNVANPHARWGVALPFSLHDDEAFVNDDVLKNTVLESLKNMPAVHSVKITQIIYGADPNFPERLAARSKSWQFSNPYVPNAEKQ